MIGIGDRAAVNVDWGEASIDPNAKEPETRIDSVVEEHEASADSDMEDNEDTRGVFWVVSFSISSSITMSLLITASSFLAGLIAGAERTDALRGGRRVSLWR